MPVTKLKFSASTNGRRVLIGTSATTIHTADASALDQIHMEAINISTNPVVLTINFGGTVSGDVIVVNLPPRGEGPRWILTGQLLTGGLVLEALGDSANISVGGFIIRDDGA